MVFQHRFSASHLFVILFCISLCGCSKPKVSHPGTAPETDQAQTLICPTYYQVRHLDGNYDNDDPELDEEELDGEELERDILTSENGIICSDGKAYCYGHSQKPIPIPENSEGYVCRNLDTGTGTYDEDKSHVEMYPYCDTDVNRYINRIIFSKPQRSWVCIDETCECGGKSCPGNARCENGECILTPEDEIKDSDICSRTDYDLFYSSAVVDAKDFGDMRRCGDAWFQADENDSGNRLCVAHPRGDVLMYLACVSTKDAGSQATEESSNENEGSQIHQYDCRCGAEECASRTVCLNDHCVELPTLTPLPSRAYVWADGRPQCSEETCACGAGTCRKGSWCIEGECSDTPYMMHVNGKAIRYGMYSYLGYIDNPYWDVERNEPLPRQYVNPPLAVWLDIIRHPTSALCDDSVLPANISDYMCIIDLVDNGCMEGAEDSYSFRGWHCVQEAGCACGDSHCPKNARCYHGQCLYDEVFYAMACGNDYTLFGRHITEENPDGSCLCPPSRIPANLFGYQCDFEGYGMVCVHSKGCECGTAHCEYDETCLSPGVCKNMREEEEKGERDNFPDMDFKH